MNTPPTTPFRRSPMANMSPSRAGFGGSESTGTPTPVVPPNATLTAGRLPHARLNNGKSPSSKMNSCQAKNVKLSGASASNNKKPKWDFLWGSSKTASASSKTKLAAPSSKWVSKTCFWHTKIPSPAVKASEGILLQLLHNHATVAVEGLPGDIGSLFRRKEGDQPSYIIGIPEPAERNLFDEGFAGFGTE